MTQNVLALISMTLRQKMVRFGKTVFTSRARYTSYLPNACMQLSSTGVKKNKNGHLFGNGGKKKKSGSGCKWHPCIRVSCPAVLRDYPTIIALSHSGKFVCKPAPLKQLGSGGSVHRYVKGNQRSRHTRRDLKIFRPEPLSLDSDKSTS